LHKKGQRKTVCVSVKFGENCMIKTKLFWETPPETSYRFKGRKPDSQ